MLSSDTIGYLVGLSRGAPRCFSGGKHEVKEKPLILKKKSVVVRRDRTPGAPVKHAVSRAASLQDHPSFIQMYGIHT